MSAQTLLNTLIAASEYALVGLSFAVIYIVARFFHFSHGAVFTCAAYAAYTAKTQLELSLGPTVVMAIGVAGLLGIALELGVYRKLRRRGANKLTLLVASMGLYLVLQNTISLIFGDSVKVLRDVGPDKAMVFWGGRITNIQVWIILTSPVTFALVWATLKFTRLGKVLRAVANDSELSKVVGIDVEKATLIAFVVGSTLAGLAAVVISLNVDMTPTMGMNALMMAVVVVIIGGVKSLRGIAVAAMLLAAARNFGVIWVGAEWQDAIAFLLLSAFLLLRPQGLFGLPLRRSSV